jgi:hypothetical protein
MRMVGLVTLQNLRIRGLVAWATIMQHKKNIKGKVRKLRPNSDADGQHLSREVGCSISGIDNLKKCISAAECAKNRRGYGGLTTETIDSRILN